MMKTLYRNLVTRQTYIKMLKWYLSNPEPSAPEDPYGNYDAQAHYGKDTISKVKKLLKQAEKSNHKFAYRTSNPFQLGFDIDNNPLNTMDYVNDLKNE